LIADVPSTWRLNEPCRWLSGDRHNSGGRIDREPAAGVAGEGAGHDAVSGAAKAVIPSAVPFEAFAATVLAVRVCHAADAMWTGRSETPLATLPGPFGSITTQNN